MLRTTALILVWLLSLVACADNNKTQNSEETSIDNQYKLEFDNRYMDWKHYCSQPDIFLMSSTTLRTNNEYYEKIIELGIPALPYIVEKMETGDFFLNKAMQKITGIDIAPWDSVDISQYKPGVQLFSAQDISQRWIQWWHEHKNDPEWQVKPQTAAEASKPQ